MADIFVRIDELSGYAASFRQLAAESATAEKTALTGLEQYVGAWGDDAPGAAFLAAYQSAATDTVGCVQQMPVQLAAVSNAMYGTAVAYLGTEGANADLASGATA